MGNSNQDLQKKPEAPLFRKEVLQRKKGSYYGKFIIINRISYTLWSLGIFILATTLILFLYFGSYTRRQEVHGMLMPDKGLINIYAKKPGTIINKFIQQGDEIKAGELIYSISTEQYTLDNKSLSEQQISLLQKQIDLQKNRISLLEKNVSRYKHLLEQHLTSEAEYQKHYDTYLSAKLSLNELEYRLSDINSASNYAIRSPADGTVSVLTTMIGDRVTEQTLLVSIIPKGASMQGVLFVPTDSIGFIKPGQKILLKYQAYPYQQFGLYEAFVDHIDKSILSPQDIKIPINLSVPIYRVIINLKQQSATIYGEPYPLIAGMLFEALILSEKRTLWQWIMSPIYNLRGSLKS